MVSTVQHEMPDANRDGRQVLLRLMLVDDHEVVRSGLRTMLEAAGDVRVVAEAGTVRDAIAEADRTKPDVIVMDVRLRLDDPLQAGGGPSGRGCRLPGPPHRDARLPGLTRQARVDGSG